MSTVFPPLDDCPKCGAYAAFRESPPEYTRRARDNEYGMSWPTRYDEWIAFPCHDCGYKVLVPTADAKPAEVRS